MSGLTRDGQACLAGPNSHARTGTGKIRFPYSADHEQDWQVYRVDPYSVESAADTYIHMCVCVCFLPIHSGHQWTYQPGSHRRKVTQDF